MLLVFAQFLNRFSIATIEQFAALETAHKKNEIAAGPTQINLIGQPTVQSNELEKNILLIQFQLFQVRLITYNSI